jgi:head-tail adaptor
VNPGALRARVEVFAPQAAGHDLGGATLAFVSAGFRWAKVDAAGAAEGAGFDGSQARTTYRAHLRMRRDIMPGWRLVWGERMLRVVAVADGDPPGAFLTLTCEEEFL